MIQRYHFGGCLSRETAYTNLFVYVFSCPWSHALNPVWSVSLFQARSQMALWCLMKSPLLIGASLQAITKPYLHILLNKELIAWNQDDGGVQGHLRATSAYADGDVRGERPARDAAAALAAAAAAAKPQTATKTSPESTFEGVTYCADGTGPIPAAQKFTFTKDSTGLRGWEVATAMTIRQGDTCLTPPAVERPFPPPPLHFLHFVTFPTRSQ